MHRLRIDILTLFPQMFEGFFSESIIRRALERGVVELNPINIRDFAQDKHRVVDDYPYGGGPGMVLKPEPVARAIQACQEASPRAKTILMTPQGEVFNQAKANQLAQSESLIILCGHYEGVDERIRELFIDEEISIGDYVLTGGELPAAVLVDSIVRLLPGVLGSAESAVGDSFSDGLLEFPQYTRPAEFMGKQVPEVLLSGNHAKVAEWRRQESLRRTWQRRPDLLRDAPLSEADRRFLHTLSELPKN